MFRGWGYSHVLTCSKPLRNVGNALFIVVLAALLPYYTYVCACATRFAVWSVCVMCVVCVSKDGAQLQTGFGWHWRGIRMLLRLTTYDNMKWVYPALAIFEVSASDTCFSFSIDSCFMVSLRRPISSACCMILASLLCMYGSN